VTEEEEKWQDKPDVVPIVNLIRRQLPSDQQQDVDGTPCFVWLWEEDGGVCPETACSLRVSCHQGWRMFQTSKGDNARPIIVKKNPRDLASKPVKKRSERNKWKGKKFRRDGYEALDRPVDGLVRHFMRGLGSVPQLPRIVNTTNFQKLYGHLGPVTFSAPKSYHAIFVDGIVVARFWMTAFSHAIVDIVPELVNPLKKRSKALGVVRIGHRDAQKMEMPVQVPDSSEYKLKPCTHRVVVRSEDAVESLSEEIRKKWKKQFEQCDLSGGGNNGS